MKQQRNQLYTSDKPKNFRFTNEISDFESSIKSKNFNLLSLGISAQDSDAKSIAKKPIQSVGMSKIGLRKPGGNIEDLQTPTKGVRRYGTMMTTGAKGAIKKDAVKLVSYAQRRTQYKKQPDLGVSSSIDDLNAYKTSYNTNRPKLGMSSDLRTLRELKKAAKQSMMEDDEREKLLFGEMENFQRNTDTRPISSRNNLIGNKTINFSGQYQIEEDDNVVYQNSSEENFAEDNIEEHDEITTPRSIIQIQSSKHQKEREMPSILKRSLMSPDTNLEVINELEDANCTPVKSKFKHLPYNQASKLLFKQKDELKEIKEEKKPEENKISSEATQRYIESKIKRRGTVAIKQPSKLELGLADDKKTHIALNKLRQEPDKSPGIKYTTSGISSSKVAGSKLKKPESNIK